MKNFIPSVIGVVTFLTLAGSGLAADDDAQLRATLSGFQSVPAILSNGTGTFKATVTATSLTFTLTFSNLSSPVTASHIHFGQAGVNGAIVVFFCGGGGKPACPANGGTVTATVTGADVVAVPAQGVGAGSFTELLRILAAGDGYVNVHTTNFPAGEIRGQIHFGF